MNKFPKDITDKFKMTEDRFWELVAEADWPNQGCNMPRYWYRCHVSKEEANEFRNMYYAVRNLVDKFIGPDRNPAGGGDDSHSDLCAHIVGLGKKQFYAHMNDYSLIEARGKAPYGDPGGYQECFAYCIPYDEDYDKDAEEINPDKPEPPPPPTRKLSSDEVINQIAEVLREGDGEFIEDIANRVLVPEVTYKGDSIFEQEIEA